MISGPIIEDKLLGRLAISTSQTDGFYENIFTDQDDVVDFLEDTSVRGRLIWNVNDDLRLDFRGGYSKVSAGAINFNATFAIPAVCRCLRRAELRPGPERRRLPLYLQHAGQNEQETWTSP
jgi:iron complex outermembrane receptor protein